MRPYHALKVSKKKKSKKKKMMKKMMLTRQKTKNGNKQESAGQGHLKYIFILKNTQQVNYFLTRWYNLKYFL